MELISCDLFEHAALQSVMHPGRFRAALAVQFLQSDADLETEPFAALAEQQVGDVRLGDVGQCSNLALAQAGRHQVGDDFFPHDANNSICCCPNQQQPLVQHLLLYKQNDGMEIEEIRRLRLRQWIDNDPVSLGDVEKWCNHYSKLAAAGDGTLSSTYIRQLVPKRGKASRNIGERVARRLERIVGRPKGSLDEEPSAGQDADTAGPINSAGRVGNAAGRIVAGDVVLKAVAGVLDAFGLRCEEVMGDMDAARARIAAALASPNQKADFPSEDESSVATLKIKMAGPDLVARATRNVSKTQYPSEVSPDIEPFSDEKPESDQERRRG